MLADLFQLSDIAAAIEKIGLGSILLVGTAFAAYRVAAWIGHKLDTLADRHLDFLAAVRDRLEADRHVLERMAATLEEILALQRQHEVFLRRDLSRSECSSPGRSA